MRGRVSALLLVLSVQAADFVLAQGSSGRGIWVSGLEYRTLSFRRPLGANRIRQFALPFGLELSRGRLSFDVGASLASSTMTRRDGFDHTVSNLTDTQLRASYVFGREAVVATLVANLPTGPGEAPVLDYTVIGAVSPAFLAFPAPVYSSGLSMVGGIATAIEAGEWSIGLAGSLKVSDQFTPYRDASGPITYKPGVEGRLRAGADGLIGSSQLTVGLTWSTFGTDQLGAGGTTTGEYRPGARVIAEGTLVAPIGSSALSVSAWNFYRAAGDTSRVSTANRENLTGGSLSLMIPAGRRVSVEPRVEGRLSKPGAGSGRWIGGGFGLRFEVSDAISLHPSVRYDRGSVTDGSGVQTPIVGWNSSLYIRVQP
jgi:hypothetical protein